MMLKDWHVVGAKIVCVFLPEDREAGEVFPAINGAYTIRDALVWQNRVYLRLAEIHNDHLDYSEYEFGAEELAFDAECFRPVVSCRTDISVFEKLLTSPEVREMVELVEKVG